MGGNLRVNSLCDPSPITRYPPLYLYRMYGPEGKTINLRPAISCTWYKTVFYEARRRASLCLLSLPAPLATSLTLTTLGSHSPLVRLGLCFLGTRGRAVGTRCSPREQTFRMGVRSWNAFRLKTAGTLLLVERGVVKTCGMQGFTNTTL